MFPLAVWVRRLAHGKVRGGTGLHLSPSFLMVTVMRTAANSNHRHHLLSSNVCKALSPGIMLSARSPPEQGLFHPLTVPSLDLHTFQGKASFPALLSCGPPLLQSFPVPPPPSKLPPTSPSTPDLSCLSPKGSGILVGSLVKDTLSHYRGVFIQGRLNKSKNKNNIPLRVLSPRA